MRTEDATATERMRVCFRRAVPGFALDVALDLPARGVSVLFGPSGAGKTTCLRVLAGLDRVPGARVEVKGEVWQDDERRVFRPVQARALGYVFQEANLFPHLSVQENLDYGRRRRGLTRTAANFDHVVERLGIAPLLERRPERLSGGERQRVAIARALLAGPRLLLMDEPLASLDLARKREILPYIERLRDEFELPVVYVSHAADEVARLADHVVLLTGGMVRASGAIGEVLPRLDLPEELADVAGVVIDGAVAGYDQNYGLLHVAFRGGVLQVPHEPLPAGRRLRVQVKARDVSLARAEPHDTSILNRLPARVVAEAPAADPAQVLVRVDVGGTMLVARITRRSRDQLGLAAGQEIWVQIKAVALLA